MSLRNTRSTYGSVAKTFHWVTFILVSGMILIGLTVKKMPDNVAFQAMVMHKSTGLMILALTSVRFFWTLINPKPELPPQAKAWEIVVEKVVHWAFYFLLILMPISGWVMATAANKPPTLFGSTPLPLPGVPIDKPLSKMAGHWHEFFAWVLIALIVLHVLAALKHHYIDKDNILKRMMPSR